MHSELLEPMVMGVALHRFLFSLDQDLEVVIDHLGAVADLIGLEA